MTAFDEAFGLSPEIVDQIDIARHVLGALVLPTTVDEIRARFAEAKRQGAKLPSERAHLDVADIPAVLKRLTHDGYAKEVSGESFDDLIAACDADPDVVQNDLDPKDTPHAKGAYYQVETRGQVWATVQANAGNDPEDPRWILTHKGYELLTGHAQADYPALLAAAEAGVAPGSDDSPEVSE